MDIITNPRLLKRDILYRVNIFLNNQHIHEKDMAKIKAELAKKVTKISKLFEDDNG
jgi:hypothetical protein